MGSCGPYSNAFSEVDGFCKRSPKDYAARLQFHRSHFSPDLNGRLHRSMPPEICELKPQGNSQGSGAYTSKSGATNLRIVYNM